MKRKMLVVMALGVLAVTATSACVVSAEDASKRVEVVAKRFAFEPSEVTVKKGVPVVLVVHSADVAHGIRFRELNVDVSVKAGATAEAHFTPAKTGDFVGKCSVFCGSGHGTMALKLHVIE